MRIRVYTAVDGQGRLRRGQLPAADAASLAEQLANEGLLLLSQRRCLAWPGSGSWWRPNPDLLTLALLCGQIAELLRAGLPMLAAFDVLIAEESRGALKNALESVRNQVNRGDSLSLALSRQPMVFDEPFVAMVHAGEAAGQLDKSLLQLERSLRWQGEASARLQKVLFYPLAAALVVCTALAFVFLHVVPELAHLLRQLGGDLPRSTLLVMDLADIAGDFAPGLLLLLVLPLLWRGAWFKRQLDTCILGAGGLGRLLIELQLARYARCAASLYASRVALIDALRLSEALLSSPRLHDQLVEVRRAMVNGRGFAEALVSARLCPQVLRRLVAAGETTNTLASSLERAADLLLTRADRTLDRIETLLPSTVLVLLGMLLLFVVLTVLLPVYDALLSSGTL